MNEQFDIASKTYDLDFTDTLTGKLQRERVWKFLDSYLQKVEGPLNILELNCGTGEDAVHFAQAGHIVLATDVSEEMLSKAKTKVIDKGVRHKVHVDKVDMKLLRQTKWEHKFDLVFSNFGGVNCLAATDLEKLKLDIADLLKPNGTLIMVIMPEFCLWESAYFLAKFRFNQAFRRKKNSVFADVSGTKVETWYHSPKRLKRLFKPEFRRKRVLPVGFFAPPSYMEHFAKRNRMLFKLISFLERVGSRFSWQSGFSDHYYIELEAR